MLFKKLWNNIRAKLYWNTSFQIWTPSCYLLKYEATHKLVAHYLHINACEYSTFCKHRVIFMIVWDTLSGSAHTKSHNRPLGGISVGLGSSLIWSMFQRVGLKPPWQQNIFLPMMAATGRQLKESTNISHNCSSKRVIPEIKIGVCYRSICGHRAMKRIIYPMNIED